MKQGFLANYEFKSPTTLTDWTVGSLLFERRVFVVKTQVLHFFLHNTEHLK